jgi:5-amino-6-(5-phosphoribosylamino)uracil reductase
MQQLIPPPRLGAVADLRALYAYPTDAPSWLRANMVSSLDGAAQAEGQSTALSGQADREIFHVLRSLADVIVVGAGTVRAEGYGPMRARERFTAARAADGQPPTASIAVISANLDLDFTSPLYAEAAVPTITVTVEQAPPERLAAARKAGEVIVAGVERVDLAVAVDQLAASGRRRMLCEGGPHLLAGLAAAGRLDELCLSLAPQLRAGHGLRVLQDIELDAPLTTHLHTLLTDDDYLFARYLVEH